MISQLIHNHLSSNAKTFASFSNMRICCCFFKNDCRSVDSSIIIISCGLKTKYQDVDVKVQIQIKYRVTQQCVLYV